MRASIVPKSGLRSLMQEPFSTWSQPGYQPAAHANGYKVPRVKMQINKLINLGQSAAPPCTQLGLHLKTGQLVGVLRTSCRWRFADCLNLHNVRNMRSLGQHIYEKQWKRNGVHQSAHQTNIKISAKQTSIFQPPQKLAASKKHQNFINMPKYVHQYSHQ